ncbi:coiled-coil domain-containing protein 81-like isoform X2 [Gallus gallus]|uniref:coiled-coil domain-containing protein 81-like isoform X2 n=1 Tax=Gallus gallus TaxID=9031 RepID=UPI001AE18294|nr:coiled-coil domain-containing protein 81-like isoform X2 [Gallus gallus]
MDALLYNSPVAGRASPDAHCQRGSPVSADLGDEIVAIWDAVSDYILEQMKLDKGVLVPGLGLFAAVREQFHSKEVAVSVRRPVFQLGHRGAVAAGPPVAHRHHPRRCQD